MSKTLDKSGFKKSYPQIKINILKLLTQGDTLVYKNNYDG